MWFGNLAAKEKARETIAESGNEDHVWLDWSLDDHFEVMKHFLSVLTRVSIRDVSSLICSFYPLCFCQSRRRRAIDVDSCLVIG